MHALVPPSVTLVETECDVPTMLYPAEQSYIAAAVEKRRAEFTTVRYCAGRALRELGLERPVMVPGRHGEPAWPDGVVGSMTHCQGYRAAAVALVRDAAAVGIDAEPNAPLPRDVLAMVASSHEAEHVRAMCEKCPDVAFDRLLFSIKESIYKAWFPAKRTWLGFHDAEVEIDAEGVFRVRLLIPEAHRGRIQGAWRVRDGILRSALVLRARSSWSRKAAGRAAEPEGWGGWEGVE